MMENFSDENNIRMLCAIVHKNGRDSVHKIATETKKQSCRRNIRCVFIAY